MRGRYGGNGAAVRDPAIPCARKGETDGGGGGVTRGLNAHDRARGEGEIRGIDGVQCGRRQRRRAWLREEEAVRGRKGTGRWISIRRRGKTRWRGRLDAVRWRSDGGGERGAAGGAAWAEVGRARAEGVWAG